MNSIRIWRRSLPIACPRRPSPTYVFSRVEVECHGVVSVVHFEFPPIGFDRIFSHRSIDVDAIAPADHPPSRDRLHRLGRQLHGQIHRLGQVISLSPVCRGDDRSLSLRCRQCLDLIDDPTVVLPQRNLIECQSICDYFHYSITPVESQFSPFLRV